MSQHRRRGELAVEVPIRITSPSIGAHQSVGPTSTPSQIPKSTAFNPMAPCLNEVPQFYRSSTSISSFLGYQFGVFSDPMAPFPSHIVETISASQRSLQRSFLFGPDVAYWTALRRFDHESRPRNPPGRPIPHAFHVPSFLANLRIWNSYLKYIGSEWVRLKREARSAPASEIT